MIRRDYREVTRLIREAFAAYKRADPDGDGDTFVDFVNGAMGDELFRFVEARAEAWPQSVARVHVQRAIGNYRAMGVELASIMALLPTPEPPSATTPEPARLDADRTAKPKTELRAAVAGHNGPVPWPGAPVSHVDRETGVRTELSAGHDAATAESGHCYDAATGYRCTCTCDRCGGGKDG